MTWQIGPRHPETDEITDWLPAQLAAFHAPGLVSGLVGGYGSGKSEFVVLAVLYGALANPGTPWALMAQTHNDLRTVLLPKMLRHLPPAEPGQPPIDRIQPGELSPMIERVSLGDRWLRLKNGSTIHWGSADTRKGWEGHTFAGGGADEIRLWRPEAWSRFVSRVRLPCPEPRLAFATTPAMGWLERYCAQDGVHTVHATSYDNPHLRSGYVENMRASMSEQEARIYIEGRFLPKSGQVYGNLTEQNVIPYAHDPSLPVYLGVDFGLRQPFVVFAQQRPGGRVVVFDELCPVEVTTEQLAAMVCERAAGQGYNLARAGVDPAGNQRQSATKARDVQVFEGVIRKHFPAFRCVWNKDPSLRLIETGVDAVRALICNANGDRSLYFAEHLTTANHRPPAVGIWQSMLGYSYPDKATTNADKPKKDGIHDHGSDALRYAAICFWLPKFRRPHSDVWKGEETETRSNRKDRDLFGGAVGGWGDFSA